MMELTPFEKDVIRAAAGLPLKHPFTSGAGLWEAAERLTREGYLKVFPEGETIGYAATEKGREAVNAPTP